MLLNASACSTCHNEPTLGGGSSDPQRFVRVRPDPEDLSGYRIHQRLKFLGNEEFEFVKPHPNTELRRSPVLYGLGLLEAVSVDQLDQIILDQAKVGITGRYLHVGGKPGRFGWKGTFPTMIDFVEHAFANELGTVPFKVGDPRSDTVVDMNIVRRTADYLRFLSPPKEPPIGPGKSLFLRIGCGSCHVPKLTTGAHEVAALSRRTFSAYTDLLLHDMGPGEPQDPPPKRAGTREFRTPPLWGLSTQKRFWHDGSASSVLEAIQKHDGEAKSARDLFDNLPPQERSEILRFLESL